MRLTPVPSQPLVVDGETVARRFEVGAITVTILNEGTLRIPGAGVFAGVPAAEWGLRVVATDGNVDLDVRAYLLEVAGERILVDTGYGSFGSSKPEFTFRGDTVAETLDRIGISSKAIGTVVNTHLHLDHAGGNFVRRVERAAHAFPNARFVVQAAELEHAVHTQADANSFYDADCLALLQGLGRLDRVDGEVALAAGSVTLVPSPGHTPGHQIVIGRSKGQTIMVLGDVAPLAAHLQVPEWLSEVDENPTTAVETKRWILDQALRTSAILASAHDPGGPYAVARVPKENGAPRSPVLGS